MAGIVARKWTVVSRRRLRDRAVVRTGLPEGS